MYGLSAGLDDSLSAWNVAQRCDHSRFLVREPLARQGWPIQSVCDNQVVQVGCVFLPRVGARVIRVRKRKSTPSGWRTMSCIPVIVSAQHWPYSRIADKRTSLISLFSSSAARSTAGSASATSSTFCLIDAVCASLQEAKSASSQSRVPSSREWLSFGAGATTLNRG